MNDNLTDEQRTRARELRNTWAKARGFGRHNSMTEETARVWLEVEKFTLQSHTCRPVWRPTTAEEIQPGWEVRSRDHLGAEATWGVAHRQTDEGGWLTESGSLLSCRGDGWAYETTAPEPKPDPRVERFAKAMYLAYTDKPWEEISEESRVSYLQDVAEVLRIFDARGGGEPNVEPGTTPTTEETTHE